MVGLAGLGWLYWIRFSSLSCVWFSELGFAEQVVLDWLTLVGLDGLGWVGFNWLSWVGLVKLGLVWFFMDGQI